MVATVELKRSVSDACILGIVVCKLRHRKESGPIILFPIHERSKVRFYRTVLSFGLAVGLWMEGGGESSLDAKEVTEQEPKLGGENRPPVADDGVGKAVVSYHHVDNYLREVRSIDGDFN